MSGLSKLNQEALRDRETQLELALDVAGIGIWQHDLAADIALLDLRAQSHFGVATDTLPIAKVLACVHPEDVEAVRQAIRRLCDPAGDGRAALEYRVVHADGSVHWLAVHARSVFGGEGHERHAVLCYGTCEEISARKAAEAALREARTRAETSAREAAELAARLGSLLAHAPVGIALMDRELRYQHVNAHLATINGLPPEAHIGCTMGEVLPTLAPRLEPIFCEVLTTGEPQLDCEIVGETRADPGKVHTWRASYFPVHAEGRLLGAGAVVVDITEQQQAEQTLHAQHEQLLTILDTLDEGVVAFHPDGTVALSNHAAHRFAGRQAVGTQELPPPPPFPLMTLIDLDDRLVPLHEWPVARVLRGERFSGEEFRARVAGEQDERWFRFSGAPVLGPNGTLTLGVFTGRDITAEKRDAALVATHTERLSRTNAELARALKLKDEFLAMMSHELRTPLSAVLGITQAMDEGVYGPVSERQRRALAQVEQSGQQLLGVLSDILDLARITSGHEQLEREHIDLDALCRSALQLVALKAQQKGITLQRAVTYGAEGVCADRRRVTQILVNLLDNAVKFTPAGGTVGLEVAVSVEREQIDFVVWDTGIGIAAEDLGRLFQPFTQLDARLARSYEGIGLGLALVQRLTELHHGSVQLESAPGAGSRFTITLPWTPDDNIAPPATRPTARPTAWSRPPRVLIADDHDVTLELYAARLGQAGCEVVVARNGAEALERIRTRRPDVVVLDIQMPELDGIGVIEAVRADAGLAALPILAVTALAMPGDRERCLAAGATCYLAKPVGGHTLLAAIAETTGLASPGDQGD